MTPLHTQFLHTVVGMTNMGYPWLVLPSVVYNTALLHSMKRMTIIKTTNTGYPCLALLLPLHITVPTLRRRTLMIGKLMVNVGYPRFAIQLITNMRALVTLSEMILLAKRVLFHTVTLLTILCLLTRFQMPKLQRWNPFRLSTPPRIQTVMTKKSIADLLLFRNPQPPSTL